jgi:hypothetical protein
MNTPVTPTAGEVRVAAFQEAAGLITNLPQDYELDPGRGDAVVVLNRLAAEAQQADTYPPALPWARLLDTEDLTEFLAELDSAMHAATTAVPITDQPRAVLDALETTCASWRAIAEAQHAHNTAPGPDAQD